MDGGGGHGGGEAVDDSAAEGRGGDGGELDGGSDTDASYAEEAEEDLDAFLLFLESRLRADFTSPDLSRIIAASAKSDGNGANSGGIGGGRSTSTGFPPSSSSSQGGRSSPSAYLRSMRRVLDRAAKPVKLRALLSVLGLEPDDGSDGGENGGDGGGGGLDRRVWKLLTGAERDDGEAWVRIVAGIVRGIMFKERGSSSNGEGDDPENLHGDVDRSGCRGPAAKKQLERTAGEVLKQIERCSVEASRAWSQAMAASYNGVDEGARKREALLDSLLIGRDASPTFVPHRYSLLGPETVRDVLPDADTNAHFLVAGSLSSGGGGSMPEIFQIDARAEAQRAEEEIREAERRRNAAAKTDAVAGRVRGGRGGVAGGRAGPTAGRNTDIETKRIMMRGRFSNRASAAGRGAEGSNLFRFSGRGRGGAAGRTGATGGRMGAVAGRMGRGGVGGRAGASAGRLGVGGGRLGAGRLGAAGGRVVGGRTAPARRMAPGSTRAMLGAGRGGAVAAPGGGGRGGLASSKNGASSAASSRMRVIGVEEVGEINRIQEDRRILAEKESVEDRKAERRRRLMEEMTTSGLKRRLQQQEGGGQPAGDGAPMEKRQRGDAPLPVPAVGGGDVDGGGINPDTHDARGGGAETELLPTADHGYEDGGTGAATASPGAIASQVQVQQMQHQQQHQAQQGGGEQILQKSNKLSDEDRRKVQQFFANRSATDPPPNTAVGGGDDTNLWKVKLNEEKTVDPQTGEVVKETLYLEMDYRTFGYKKTRKIKRK